MLNPGRFSSCTSILDFIVRIYLILRYVRLLIFTNTCTHRCNERITQNSLNDVEIDAEMADALNFDDFHKIVCISPNSASKNKFLGSILPQRVCELLPILVPMGSLTCNLRVANLCISLILDDLLIDVTCCDALLILSRLTWSGSRGWSGKNRHLIMRKWCLIRPQPD